MNQDHTTAVTLLSSTNESWVKETKLGVISIVFDPAAGDLIGMTSTPAIAPLMFAEMLIRTAAEMLAREGRKAAVPQEKSKIVLS